VSKPEEKHESLHQSVHVDCSIEAAFRLFTESFGEWWPLALYATAEDAESCVLEPFAGGRLFERTRSGEEHDWGCVVEWNPPAHLRFAWDPRGTGNRRETVDVEFAVEAYGTRVTVIHSGWQTTGIAVSALAHFGHFATAEVLVTA